MVSPLLYLLVSISSGKCHVGSYVCLSHRKFLKHRSELVHSGEDVALAIRILGTRWTRLSKKSRNTAGDQSGARYLDRAKSSVLCFVHDYLEHLRAPFVSGFTVDLVRPARSVEFFGFLFGFHRHRDTDTGGADWRSKGSTITSERPKLFLQVTVYEDPFGESQSRRIVCEKHLLRFNCAITMAVCPAPRIRRSLAA